MMPFQRSWLPAALLALLLGSACASTESQARKIATVGAAYGRAMDTLLRTTEEVAVDADSARLLSEAQGLSRSERRSLLEKHAAVADTIGDLERLRRHARLLVRYFEALHTIAEAKTDVEAADTTVALANALNRVGKELTGSKLLTPAERDLAAETTRLSFHAFRHRAITRELEARGAAIEQELRIQQALLEAVRRKIKADAESVLVLGRERDVTRPFVEGALADPGGWIAARRSSLLAPLQMDDLKNASEAASKLRSAWLAYMAGRSDDAALLTDLDEVLGFAESVKAAVR
jgi:hypothetical protein